MTNRLSQTWLMCQSMDLSFLPSSHDIQKGTIVFAKCRIYYHIYYYTLLNIFLRSMTYKYKNIIGNENCIKEQYHGTFKPQNMQKIHFLKKCFNLIVDNWPELDVSEFKNWEEMSVEKSNLEINCQMKVERSFLHNIPTNNIIRIQKLLS